MMRWVWATDGAGASNLFIGIGFVVLAAGLGVSAYRVARARREARQAGLNPNTATRRALTGADVPEPVRKKAPLTSSVAARLTELRDLLDQGLITQQEHDDRRRAIIDSL